MFVSSPTTSGEQTLYAALELSKNSWLLAIQLPDRDNPSLHPIKGDPASVQVDRRARRVKTDRIDVEKLLHTLIAWCRGERHVCSMVVSA